MPRAPRILVEGGLYHVHIRFARGKEVFAAPEEAIEFLDLFRELKQRDDLQVFAWSLLETLEFVELVCTRLETTIDVLASSRKDRETTRIHQLVATVGIELGPAGRCARWRPWETPGCHQQVGAKRRRKKIEGC